MKLEITLLALEPMVSAKGNKYGNGQVIFHDDKITAGPCRIFGDLYEDVAKNFQSGVRYLAELTLQPDANGTRVQIDSLTPLKVASQPSLKTA